MDAPDKISIGVHAEITTRTLRYISEYFVCPHCNLDRALENPAKSVFGQVVKVDICRFMAIILKFLHPSTHLGHHEHD